MRVRVHAGTLTVASTATLNGNVNLGDTTGDSVTVAGSKIWLPFSLTTFRAHSVCLSVHRAGSLAIQGLQLMNYLSRTLTHSFPSCSARASAIASCSLLLSIPPGIILADTTIVVNAAVSDQAGVQYNTLAAALNYVKAKVLLGIVTISVQGTVPVAASLDINMQYTQPEKIQILGANAVTSILQGAPGVTVFYLENVFQFSLQNLVIDCGSNTAGRGVWVLNRSYLYMYGVTIRQCALAMQVEAGTSRSRARPACSACVPLCSARLAGRRALPWLQSIDPRCSRRVRLIRARRRTDHLRVCDHHQRQERHHCPHSRARARGAGRDDHRLGHQQRRLWRSGARLRASPASLHPSPSPLTPLGVGCRVRLNCGVVVCLVACAAVKRAFIRPCSAHSAEDAWSSFVLASLSAALDSCSCRSCIRSTRWVTWTPAACTRASSSSARAPVSPAPPCPAVVRLCLDLAFLPLSLVLPDSRAFVQDGCCMLPMFLLTEHAAACGLAGCLTALLSVLHALPSFAVALAHSRCDCCFLLVLSDRWHGASRRRDLGQRQQRHQQQQLPAHRRLNA